MTIENIFNKLANHMIEGIMYHDEMAEAYNFLGLRGYAKCHDYHHFTEEKCYRELSFYYTTHYFKLLQVGQIPQPKIIPETWYNYTTQDVDINTKRQAVKDLFEKWTKWEHDTKKLYEEMYLELTNLREVAAACYIKKYICEVDDELADAENKLIQLNTLNYDINTLINNQDSIYKKYESKLQEIFE